MPSAVDVGVESFAARCRLHAAPIDGGFEETVGMHKLQQDAPYVGLVVGFKVAPLDGVHGLDEFGAREHTYSYSPHRRLILVVDGSRDVVVFEVAVARLSPYGTADNAVRSVEEGQSYFRGEAGLEYGLTGEVFIGAFSIFEHSSEVDAPQHALLSCGTQCGCY